MNRDFIDYFSVGGAPVSFDGNSLVAPNAVIPIRNGIPRFTPNVSYSSGNFSRLREQHAKLQFDSVNGTGDRRTTLLSRTGWPEEYFKGKTVLECGCGAGPDTEILLSLGARVISVDLAGVDVAKLNIGDNPNHCLIQASILDLPLREKSFDIVFCHRVLQHTPNPEATLRHILRFVRPDGAAFVHSYAKTIYQMLRWKYALRPLTKRMDSERLYRLIEWYSRPAFKVTRFLNSFYLGKVFTWVAIPFLNYRHVPQFKDRDDKWIIELAVHDTFDALSPPYDRPLSAKTMRNIGAEYLDRPIEVVEEKMITLLRTLL